ncbi:Ig-like domain-containing protein [uncultured Methanobrevibacter sp.]|uniref:Ig-like domain-containing protein n=1 Tax=uncultured Methanobrevibacter sp. TaxID=253161 RepID=UPI0037436C47
MPKFDEGNYKYVINYSGDSKYSSFENTGSIDVAKPDSEIVIPPLYKPSEDGSVAIKLPSDATGTVTLVINGKTYSMITDKNGQVMLSTNGLAPKSYSAKVSFTGNTNYIGASKSFKVAVKKATPKLTAKAKTFKKSVKTKKYVITLKTNQNKVMKNTNFILKVNGKTYLLKLMLKVRLPLK